MADTPDQPDGIDEQSRDLPDPARAAARVNEFLSAWGDGLIPLEYPVVPPLYARDLQALANLASPLPADEVERQQMFEVGDSVEFYDSTYGTWDTGVVARDFGDQRVHVKRGWGGLVERCHREDVRPVAVPVEPKEKS